MAGTFYPGDPEELRDVICACLEQGRRHRQRSGAVAPKALIAPHAGYVYSGPIAGSAYAAIEPVRKRIERVVLLGPSHRVAFRGLALSSADVNRSEAYLSLLPLITTGRIELPPDPRLRTELLGLERRTARGGRDSVDHRPGGHDDLANATALAAWAASRRRPGTNSRLVVGYSTLMDGMAGPVVRERTHPADRRETDSIWQKLQNDLF